MLYGDTSSSFDNREGPSAPHWAAGDLTGLRPQTSLHRIQPQGTDTTSGAWAKFPSTAARNSPSKNKEVVREREASRSQVSNIVTEKQLVAFSPWKQAASAVSELGTEKPTRDYRSIMCWRIRENAEGGSSLNSTGILPSLLRWCSALRISKCFLLLFNR